MDWTPAMALEAGVWGKAGWLALHSHLEGLLALASVPQHLPSLPPLRPAFSVWSPSFWLSSRLCASVCHPWDVCACVCMHTRVCICSLLSPSESGCHCWLLGLSPAASVPQPEREEMVTDAHYVWAAGPEHSWPPGQSASFQFSQSGSRLGGNGYWDSSWEE